MTDGDLHAQTRVKLRLLRNVSWLTVVPFLLSVEATDREREREGGREIHGCTSLLFVSEVYFWEGIIIIIRFHMPYTGCVSAAVAYPFCRRIKDVLACAKEHSNVSGAFDNARLNSRRTSIIDVVYVNPVVPGTREACNSFPLHEDAIASARLREYAGRVTRESLRPTKGLVPRDKVRETTCVYVLRDPISRT